MSARKRLVEYIKESNLRIVAVASAPARADFLNTHQDYKGLPVVPIAIDKRIYFAAVEGDPKKFTIESLDISEEDIEKTFHISDIVPKGRTYIDYAKACLLSLVMMTSTNIPRGYRIIISSDIPIGGGLGSSGAFEVGFLYLITQLYKIRIPKLVLAEIAYRAENRILNISCGRLDQYASAFGGTLLLKTTWPTRVEILSDPPYEIIIVDSGIKHETAAIHPTRQAEINKAIEKLKGLGLPKNLEEKLGSDYKTAKWADLKEDEIMEYIDQIEDVLARRILFTIRMNDLTKIAVKILKNKELTSDDYKTLKRLNITSDSRKEILCEIINRQHELLRDYYDVSTPKMEEIIDSMISAGAKCAKISGAGLGGCIVALCEYDDVDSVIKASLDSGAKSAWHVAVDEGVKTENLC